MRRNWKLFLSVLMALAILVSMAVPAMAAETEIKVPVSIGLTDAVAGVQLSVKVDEGLTFVKWVLPEAYQKLASTPYPRSDDGLMTIGIFGPNNVIEPAADGGLVDLGYLVFSGTGSTPTIEDLFSAHVVSNTEIETLLYNSLSRRRSP